jgi:hypothetical protein
MYPLYGFPVFLVTGFYNVCSFRLRWLVVMMPMKSKTIGKSSKKNINFSQSMYKHHTVRSQTWIKVQWGSNLHFIRIFTRHATLIHAMHIYLLKKKEYKYIVKTKVLWRLFVSVTSYEPRHDKTNIVRLRQAWIQTSLRIRAVWSGSMLFAYQLYYK